MARPRDTEIRRIGRQLRLLREKSGRTLAQLAEVAGLSERAVRELEAGRTNPSLTTAVGIAEALGVSLDELVAAARYNLPPADFTPAPAEGEAVLTRQLPTPRMRARLVDLHDKPEADLPAGPIFGHVLDGVIRVALDGQETGLNRNDSFHAQARVLGGWQAGARGGRLLVVEAVAADPSVAQRSQQEPE